MIMKRLLMMTAALLVLTAEMAFGQAAEKWEANCRQLHISKWFSDAELAEIGWQRYKGDNIQGGQIGQNIVIGEDEIADIEKAIRRLKPCRAFWKCIADREAGKVKHCYENDRRWR